MFMFIILLLSNIKYNMYIHVVAGIGLGVGFICPISLPVYIKLTTKLSNIHHAKIILPNAPLKSEQLF